MGTTYIRDPGSYADEKREVLSILTWGNDAPFSAEVLQLSKVGNTWYGAIRFSGKIPESMLRDYKPEDPETLTWAVVIKTHRADGEWGYKDMTEAMGPHEAKAPLGLIKKLTPVDPDSYAARWRNDCRAWANRVKPKPGQKVRLKEPVFFGSVAVQELTRVANPARTRGPVFLADGVGLCRLRPDNLVGATIIS